MANRKKEESNRSTATIMVRVTPNFKTRVDEAVEAALDTGMLDKNGKPYESLSGIVRTLLEEEMQRWETLKPQG